VCSSDLSKDYYTEKSQQGLSAGITAINAGGGNPNDIAKILSAYDDGIGKIAVADAETHLNNIRYYMNVNKDLAGQKTIQWAVNKREPYMNTLKELSAAQKAGEATKNEAYGDAMSSLSSFGTSMAGSGGFGGKKGGGANMGRDAVSGANYGMEEGFVSNSGSGFSGGGGGVMPYGSSGMRRGFDGNGISGGGGGNFVSDPFSNSSDDYAKYQQWLKFQEQQGERKGGW
jgi:hypothetical protein